MPTAARPCAARPCSSSASCAAGDELARLYARETSPEVKKRIIQGLFISRDATRLVELAKAEKDLELKKDIVQKLSLMKSKEATDYLVELLKCHRAQVESSCHRVFVAKSRRGSYGSHWHAEHVSGNWTRAVADRERETGNASDDAQS